MQRNSSGFEREISIIGTGKAGTSLAHSLKKKGWKIRFLFDKYKSMAIESRKILGEGKIGEIEEILEKGNFFILSVPDSELEKIAKKIAEKSNNLAGKTFIHLSGSLSNKVLIPIRERGGLIGALHPIFPFPTKVTEIPEGVYFGWDGESRALRKCIRIVKDLKGKLIKIKKEKVLYHLGCSIASNLISILYLIAVEKSKKAGIKEEISKDFLLQLCLNSLNSVRDNGWEGVTGPAARGDKETIANHLKNLSPREKNIYKEILLYYLEKGIVEESEKIIQTLK